MIEKKLAFFSLLLLSIPVFSFDIKVKIFSQSKLKEISIESLKNPVYEKCQKINVRIKNPLIEIQCGNIKKLNKKLEISYENYFYITAKDKKRLYTGKISISNEKGFLKIINEIELEKYLVSVVNSETSDLSNYQAYKAQAVVARTYTLANINRHKSEGYNLCDLTHCQLYKGFKEIRKDVEKAVYETKGEIIIYRGKPIWAFYHSICGGMTEDIKYLWQYEEKPYLKSIYDGNSNVPYCFNAKGFKWRTKIGNKTFENFLKRNIVSKNEEIKDIKISKTTPSERVLEMEIYTDKRIKKISGIDFYHIIGRDLGWEAIRSTKFKIYKEPNFFVFEGYGYGHGIGMCQHGADRMAELGYDYREIIKHYYKDIKIVKSNL